MLFETSIFLIISMCSNEFLIQKIFWEFILIWNIWFLHYFFKTYYNSTILLSLYSDIQLSSSFYPQKQLKAMWSHKKYIGHIFYFYYKRIVINVDCVFCKLSNNVKVFMRKINKDIYRTFQQDICINSTNFILTKQSFFVVLFFASSCK